MTKRSLADNMSRILVSLLILSIGASGQPISPAKQKALNNYVEYANGSADEVSSLFNKIYAYYGRLSYFKKKTQRPSFTCSDQLDDSWYDKAISSGANFSNGSSLTAKTKGLRTAAEKLDEECKALDTYHKLQDYERDNFKQADQLINDIQVSLKDYQQKYVALMREVEAAYRKLQPPVASNPNDVADRMMKKEIDRERAWLDSWNFNLNEEVHSGWPADRISASILDTDNAVKLFSRTKPALQYPASSMYSSFAEALGAVLDVKRRGLDGYNFEARKDDRHSNQVYLDLINYFNGTLVADHNTFIGFAQGNGFYGLESFKYFPLFEIRSVAEQAATQAKPFQDIPHSSISIAAQGVPLPRPVFTALDSYVTLINESMRQISYLYRVLRNYNSSATYYKDLTSYKGKGGLTFSHEHFEIPLSLFQAAISQSNAIPGAYRKSLNDQAQVLINIMKEMDELSIELSLDASEKRYEKDNLKRAYEILERQSILFDIIDLKKEQLYLDVRAIYESYKVANPSGSWSVSNRALLTLVDEDRKQLFKAKAFYKKGDSTSRPSVDLIDTELRDVISKEFSNMKGIERYGRSNGLCPYTPYEDIPQNSRTLSEKLARTGASGKPADSPYSDLVYLYNSIASDYNKFCELAKIDLLKTVEQPELFTPKYPEKRKSDEVVAVPFVAVGKAQTEGTDNVPKVKESKNPSDDQKPGMVAAGVSTHRTDTVFVEKHDTIYMDRANDDPNSLEGYAYNNMVFLLDVSGSMSEGHKLPLLKKSMLVLVNMLRPEDQVTLVVYSGKARVVLPSTSGEQKDKIRKAIENLDSEGYTDGNAGIQLAYKVADENYIRAGNNRIVLATDGEFGINNATMKMVSKYSDQDIFLSVFVFGSSAAIKNLEKLAATGKGHYETINIENSDSKLIREAKGKKKK